MKYVHVTDNVVDGVASVGNEASVLAVGDASVYCVEQNVIVAVGYTVTFVDGYPVFSPPVPPVG